MQSIETIILGIVRRTESVVSMRVSIPEGFSFQAGQFSGVTLLNDGAEISRYLSFSSSPTEAGYVEFTKRLTASDFSRALNRLHIGDAVRIKLPLGKFVLEENREKHAFLAGGIGITPIRSMWSYAIDRGIARDKVLLYSNRSADEIIFKDYFEASAARDKGCKIVFSLDNPGECPVDWKGRCGYIDADMIRAEIPDYKERVFYVCGPVAMVKKMMAVLKEDLLVAEENIRRENISGY